MRDRKGVFGPSQDLSGDIKAALRGWLRELTSTQLLVLAVCGDNEKWCQSDVFIVDHDTSKQFMTQFADTYGEARRFMLMVVTDHDLAYGMYEYFDGHHPYEIVMNLAVREFVTTWLEK